MVDYYFPPLAGAGVQRTLGYVRHMAEFGWTPIVLTVQSGEHGFVDASLLERVPPQVAVRRTRSFEPIRLAKVALGRGAAAGSGPRADRFKLFVPVARRLRDLTSWVLFPDRHVGWLPFALAEALSIGRRTPIDVIYSSSTAITSHLVARSLKRRWGRPWVADFQDPWVDRHDYGFPSPLHRVAAERLERLIVQEADCVTVTTGPLGDIFRRRYGDVAAEKLVVIPMGFDPEALQGLTPIPRRKFTITHFGNFYGRRSPAPFLTALGQCAEDDEGLVRDTEVLLFGAFDFQFRALSEEIIQRYRLENVVRLEDLVPYRTGLQYLVSSDVLLLVTDSAQGGKSLIPSKLYEYLAVDRPILALVPDGAAAEIIRAAEGGMIVGPDDLPGIKAAILSLYQRWKHGQLASSTNPAVVQRFTWRQLTSEFCDTLGRVLTPE